MSKSSNPKTPNQHFGKEQRALERLGFMQKETRVAECKPGAWSVLPKAKADWDSSNTNENIAQTLSGDVV